MKLCESFHCCFREGNVVFEEIEKFEINDWDRIQAHE